MTPWLFPPVSSRELGDALPDISNRMSAQLAELHRAPCPSRAAAIAFELEGVRRYLLSIRELLMREARAPDA